jgi:diguanylate cyclase (GGDEF)-like protein
MTRTTRMLRRVTPVPMHTVVTPGIQTHTDGDTVAVLSPRAEQLMLLGELVEATARNIPSLTATLRLIERRLAGPCGLRAITVFTLDPDDGSLRVAKTLGPAGADDRQVAGRVFRVAAGAPGVRADDRTALRLRMGGQTHGVAVLTGEDLDNLLPDVAAGVALQLAVTLQVIAAERDRQHVTHATNTIKKMYEEGSGARSVEAAAQVLARITNEAFRTDRAVVHLIGPDGRIASVTGFGMLPEMANALARSLEGRRAADSAVWRTVHELGTPLLLDDTSAAATRPGGLVETLGLRSLVVLPLTSTTGPVGMVLCGDVSGPRHWTGRERTLAQQMALEGALVVDGARLRQAEQQHVAELTRQAYHDALTGLANRTHLLERAEREVAAATEAGERLALLLIDLDGFKRVNDTAGHHFGDALLQAVGRRLQRAVRGHDVVARLGGDEFAVLLTHDPDEGQAEAIARRLHERLCAPYTVEGRRIDVGASVGITMFPDQAGGMAALMRTADAAMYRAKRTGGGVTAAAA